MGDPQPRNGSPLGEIGPDGRQGGLPMSLAAWGSGLGLYLTRRIVAAHGGSVYAGTADGRSAFRIELPLGMDGRQASAS
jgi:light-regulated signal transduction histidine kinase (bacteriophytochrome)